MTGKDVCAVGFVGDNCSSVSETEDVAGERGFGAEDVVGGSWVSASETEAMVGDKGFAIEPLFAGDEAWDGLETAAAFVCPAGIEAEFVAPGWLEVWMLEGS